MTRCGLSNLQKQRFRSLRKYLPCILIVPVITSCAATPSVSVLPYGTDLDYCEELEAVYATGKSEFWANRNAENAVVAQGGDTLLLNEFQEFWFHTTTQSVAGVAYRCGTSD